MAVELIFDVPEGAAAEDIRIYQLFIDGSLSERKVTVVDDKKVKLSVYRLGQYIMGIGDSKAVDKNSQITDTPQKDNNGYLWALIGATVIVAAAAVFVIVYLKRKGRLGK